jgi:hypothetical protein
MKKTKEGRNKNPVTMVSLLRKAWLNVVLLLIAGAVIGVGVYLGSQAHLLNRSGVNWYNQGVSTYNLPEELLPATDDRPSEYPIVRAAVYFQQSVLESNNDNLRALALYNLGTLMGEDALATVNGSTTWFGVADAISRLIEAVRVDPTNENAKYNLELLEEVLTTEAQEQGLTDFMLWQAYVPTEGFFLGEVDKGF